LNRPRGAAFATALVMLAAVGCGSMASSSDKQAAERAQLGVGTVQTVPSGTGATSAPSVTTGSTLPSGGNGGATAVGVTANSVTVGSVATISGPDPGLFKGAASGAQAYFAYINSKGGVYGRDLKLDDGDDGFQCALNESLTASQIKKDFAEVGGFSLFDNCGAIPLKVNPGVPDVHQAISSERSILPNNFSVQPLVPGASSGPYQFFKSNFGNAYQHAAILYANIPASVTQFKYTEAAMKSLGYTIVVTDGYSPTDTNFTSDVIQMRSKGVKFVDIAGDPATIARFVQAAHQQNWHPIVTTPGSGYDKTTLAVGGSAVNGMYTTTPTALYFNAADAARIPGVALFQKWMHTAVPSQVLDLYSVYGWSSAALFVQALRAAGPMVTRAKVMTALQHIHKFSNQVMPPSDPANKSPVLCYVITKVVKGQFIRYQSPAKGFVCNGRWVS
jgi:branched-chain amino acid transport system substrate-binding protein